VSTQVCHEAQAQAVGRQPLRFSLSEPVERLEMIVNTSRILTTEHSIPKLLVDNEKILRAQPMSPNQVQLSAVKTGFTTLTVWDETGKEHSVDILVYGDARELENVLMTEFPDATLRVRPLAHSVVVTGYVPRADMVSRIVQISEDYYPSVINNMTVGGVQQVLLHVKVMEVSRTKLQRMGFDWALFNGDDAIIQNVAGMIAEYSVAPSGVLSTGGENVAAAIIDGNNAFFGFLEALRQHDLVKVLAEPTLVTVSGRPASFSSGGEFPILVPQNSLGSVSIEYREFGTRVDFVPIVLGNGRVRLEVRPQVSEIDPARSVSINGTTVPGLRTRWADTAVEMNAGQTLALAGLIQTQVEAQTRGLPWLSDLPWIGAAFRRVEQKNNEIELLIMVTPEFVSALDPHEVPPCGPGQLTGPPNDIDFYWRGYLEVPKCCSDGSCPNCQQHGAALPATYDEITPSDFPSPDGIPQVNPASHGRTRRDSQEQSLQQPALIGPSGYEELP
jgi:pilus assembly protein CpaC